MFCTIWVELVNGWESIYRSSCLPITGLSVTVERKHQTELSPSRWQYYTLVCHARYRFGSEAADSLKTGSSVKLPPPISEITLKNSPVVKLKNNASIAVSMDTV